MRTDQIPSISSPPRSWKMVPILVVLITAGILRLAWLGTLPPGLNQDEAVHAYEAWCLRTLGQDHTGRPWPAFVRAYGRADYHAVPFIYCLIPSQWLFGVNAWSTRLPAALLGTLTCLALYALVRRIWGPTAAFWAALMLAVSPWHIHLSRLAFEVSICPAMITLALWLLAGGLTSARPPGLMNTSPPPVPQTHGRKVCHSPADAHAAGRPATPLRSALLLAGSGLLFGLTLWTYNAMRIIVPLLLLLGAALYLPEIRQQLRLRHGRIKLSAYVIGFVMGLSPFIAATIHDPQQAWGRAAALSLLAQPISAWEKCRMFARTYAAQISPDFLFLNGDPYIVQSVPGFGQLQHVDAIFLALGLYQVARRRLSDRFAVFVLLWILISPIPAALSVLDWGHCLRSAGALPAYQILAALGLSALLAGLQRRGPRLYRWMSPLALFAIGMDTLWFCCLATVRYPSAAYPEFQAEWGEVVPYVQQIRSGYDGVLLSTEQTNQLGMLYLFWSRTHPSEYARMHRVIDEGPYYDNILQIGQTLFVPSRSLTDLLRNGAIVPGMRLLIAERPGIPVPGSELRRFYYPDGIPAVFLYEVTIPADIPATGAAYPR